MNMRNTERWLGRRFTLESPPLFRGGFLTTQSFDLTITGYDPAKGYRWHAVDGSKGWYPIDMMEALFDVGKACESAKAPFVLD